MLCRRCRVKGRFWFGSDWSLAEKMGRFVIDFFQLRVTYRQLVYPNSKEFDWVSNKNLNEALVTLIQHSLAELERECPDWATEALLAALESQIMSKDNTRESRWSAVRLHAKERWVAFTRRFRSSGYRQEMNDVNLRVNQLHWFWHDGRDLSRGFVARFKLELICRQDEGFANAVQGYFRQFFQDGAFSRKLVNLFNSFSVNSWMELKDDVPGFETEIHLRLLEIHFAERVVALPCEIEPFWTVNEAAKDFQLLKEDMYCPAIPLSLNVGEILDRLGHIQVLVNQLQ